MIFSLCGHVDQIKLKELIRNLGGEVTDAITTNTIIITTQEELKKEKKPKKISKGIISNCFFVSSNYVLKTKEDNKKPNITQYLLSPSTSTSNSNSTSNSASNSNLTSPISLSTLNSEPTTPSTLISISTPISTLTQSRSHRRKKELTRTTGWNLFQEDLKKNKKIKFQDFNEVAKYEWINLPTEEKDKFNEEAKKKNEETNRKKLEKLKKDKEIEEIQKNNPTSSITILKPPPKLVKQKSNQSLNSSPNLSPNLNPNSNSDPNSNLNPNSNPNPNLSPNLNPNSNSDSDSNSNSNSNPNLSLNSDFNSNLSETPTSSILTLNPIEETEKDFLMTDMELPFESFNSFEIFDTFLDDMCIAWEDN